MEYVTTVEITLGNALRSATRQTFYNSYLRTVLLWAILNVTIPWRHGCFSAWRNNGILEFLKHDTFSICQSNISWFFQYPYWIMLLQSFNDIHIKDSTEPNNILHLNTDRSFACILNNCIGFFRITKLLY